MSDALVIGASGYVGRHAVVELLDSGYDVATLSRGAHGYTLPASLPLDRHTGDRSDRSVLAGLARSVAPDVVVDCAAFRPDAVRVATEVFADAEAYVYVSSGSVYARQDIPKREAETPLRECTPEQAHDDAMASYPARKAAGDREVVAAADRGRRAMSVRPTVIYGPKTVTADESPPGPESPAWAGGGVVQTRHDYWIDRIARHDRIVVPGDGTAIWHRAYVESVARALRVVAECGEPGEAYNVGDRLVCTLGDVVDLIADALDTEVDVVHASARELAEVGLEPGDFPFYHHPMTGYPHVLSTGKLAALGWTAAPPDAAMAATVAESTASERTGAAHDPGRDAEERLIDAVVD